MDANLWTTRQLTDVVTHNEQQIASLVKMVETLQAEVQGLERRIEAKA